MDLKPGRVRIFQCEACGEVFGDNSLEARARQHQGVESVDDGCGGCDPEPYNATVIHLHPCGPISERILADEARIRREVIEECEEVMTLAWTKQQLAPFPDASAALTHCHIRIRALAEE